MQLVSPALADANNGNWRTAARWQRHLSHVAEVRLTQGWPGEPADVMIALHARRSGEAVAAFRAAWPRRGLAVVLTGTDLYRDLPDDPVARRSLALADELIVLQDEALHAVPVEARPKTRVLLQSAPGVRLRRPADGGALVAIGHLREEKDPQTLWRALPRLQNLPGFRLDHYGAALDARLGEQALHHQAAHPGYRWHGAVSAASARAALARSRGLVHMSRMEGGANVMIEAVRSGVPVIASRIPGNLGLLGAGYDGFFEPGDAQGLAEQVRRLWRDAGFEHHLRQQCAEREPLFTPACERAALQALVQRLLQRALTDNPFPPRLP